MAADRFSLLAGIASDWWWEMGADEEEASLDQKTLARVQRIGRATQRARDLTRQLLAFSRR